MVLIVREIPMVAANVYDKTSFDDSYNEDDIPNETTES